ncbi:hypothetical protein [Rhodococcus sp. NPDC049939]|uniref:hypothetical protein n=1 Tax=Rhodococcus sp. NPDC049939 TaxID=3155511 RepID=UPI0033F69108
MSTHDMASTAEVSELPTEVAIIRDAARGAGLAVEHLTAEALVAERWGWMLGGDGIDEPTVVELHFGTPVAATLHRDGTATELDLMTREGWMGLLRGLVGDGHTMAEQAEEVLEEVESRGHPFRGEQPVRGEDWPTLAPRGIPIGAIETHRGGEIAVEDPVAGQAFVYSLVGWQVQLTPILQTVDGDVLRPPTADWHLVSEDAD